MPRRVSLPAADDLFRATQPGDAPAAAPKPSRVRAVPDAPAATADPAESDAGEDAGARRRPSGRVRHDEKITIYVTAEELLDLERARLTLRGQHGLAADRGRLVREAVAMVLADLDERGEDSALVARLREG